jgi:acyl carrier protein
MDILNSQVCQTSKFVDSNNANLHESSMVQEIQTWLIPYIAELLEIKPDEVNPTIPFERYGLDSSSIVGLTGDLGEWLGVDIDPDLLYEYPTIETLANHLASIAQV